MCGVHCELDVPIFQAHLPSSPYNRWIEGCISLRQIILEAESLDIRVTMLFSMQDLGLLTVG
jgi:hypothetical protein